MLGTMVRFGPIVSGSSRLALPPPMKMWSGSTISSKASSAFSTRLRHACLPTFCRSLSPHATSMDRPVAEAAVRQLHVRQQGAVEEHRAAHAGAEGDHQLHAAAGRSTAQPCTSASLATRTGLPKRLRQRALQVVADPLLDAASGRVRLAGRRAENAVTSRTMAAADRAREADGHPVVVAAGSSPARPARRAGRAACTGRAYRGGRARRASRRRGRARWPSARCPPRRSPACAVRCRP